MIEVGRIEVQNTLTDLDQIQQSQLPYALSVALTQAAKRSTDAAKQRFLSGVFITRNNWTERGFWFERSSKRNLESSVDLRRWYMPLHETGGIKVSRKGGGHYIAIPVAPELRRVIIKAQQRPGFLIGQSGWVGKGLGGSMLGAFLKGKRPRAKAAQEWGKGFIKDGKNGHKLLYITLPDHTLKLMYVLVPSELISYERLQMFNTVKEVVQREWASCEDYGMNYAMSTWKPKAAGGRKE